MAGKQAQDAQLGRWRQWRLTQDYPFLGFVRGDLVIGERRQPKSGSAAGRGSYPGHCASIERRASADTRVTAYRLAA